MHTYIELSEKSIINFCQIEHLFGQTELVPKSITIIKIKLIAMSRRQRFVER